MGSNASRNRSTSDLGDGLKSSFFVKRSSTPPPAYETNKELRSGNEKDQKVVKAEAEPRVARKSWCRHVCPGTSMSTSQVIHVHTSDGQIVDIIGSYMTYISPELQKKFLYYSDHKAITNIYFDDSVLETARVFTMLKTLSEGKEISAPGDSNTRDLLNLVSFLQKYNASKAMNSLEIIVHKWVLQDEISPIIAFNMALGSANVKLAAACIRINPDLKWTLNDILVHPEAITGESVWDPKYWPIGWKTHGPKKWIEVLEKAHKEPGLLVGEGASHKAIADVFQSKLL